MSHVSLHIPANKKPHCPGCGAFLAYQNITERLYCRKCGFALATETRRAETTGSGSKTFQSGPKGNAQYYQTKTRQLPNGKILKTRKKTNEDQQLNLFVGVSVVDGSGWLQQEAF